MKSIVKMRWSFLIVAAALALPLSNASASVKQEVSHEDIIVQKGQVISGDVVTDKSILADGRIDGDATAVGGGSVTVNGEITGDLVSVGGPVSIAGTVDGDVSSIGGPVEVSGVVKGDISAVGGDIKLTGTARVAGDLSVLGGSVDKGPQTVHKGSVSHFSRDALKGTIVNVMNMVRSAGRYNWDNYGGRRGGWATRFGGDDFPGFWTKAGIVGFGLLVFLSVLFAGMLMLLLPAVFFPVNTVNVHAALKADIWKSWPPGGGANE